MIIWLMQSASDQPDLARGIAPAGLLSDSEQARLATFKIEKRRRDWLLGRWTAKRLVQSYVEQQTGLCLPLDRLIIDSHPDGAPYLVAASPYHLLPAIGDLRLSISHAGDRAVSALVEEGRIGADIERIAPRGWQFVEDYFSADEIVQVRASPAEQRQSVVTAIWSAKESALKALRLGLTVDTRSVVCSIAEPKPAGGWADIGFAFDGRLLGPVAAPALSGWWRMIDGYILTIAAAAAAQEGQPQPAGRSSVHPVLEG